jgi:hypothetical protein
MKPFSVGDKVHVSGDTESCCFAEDAGEYGVIVRVRSQNNVTVRTRKGDWQHCSECISHMSDVEEDHRDE